MCQISHIPTQNQVALFDIVTHIGELVSMLKKNR